MTTLRDPKGLELRLLQDFVDFSTAAVLEIGCGDGYLTWQYAASAGRVVGIDMAVETLGEARAKRSEPLATPVSFVAGMGDRLPFPNGCFDIVVFSSSL